VFARIGRERKGTDWPFVLDSSLVVQPRAPGPTIVTQLFKVSSLADIAGAALDVPGTDVFLSYKAEDRARLKPLVAALEAEGFSVWWDAHIGGGANWREDIQNHLDGAKCVIVAWTRRSIARDGNFVRDEAAQAQRRGVYLPIRLDLVQPPLGFGEVQALPLRGWRGDRSDARFQALAAAIRSAIAGQGIAHPHSDWEAPRVSRRALIGGGAGVAALAAAGGWLILKPGPAHAQRIAVLPFVNLSSDPEQKYFADGLAEELRGALSRIGLQVIGRSSSEAVAKEDSASIVKKLNVLQILTGSVRRSPTSIRISTQLVDGRNGVETWARTYDSAPGELIDIQTDIAEQIARSLSWTIGPEAQHAIGLGGTRDAVALDFLLQAVEVSQAQGTTEKALRSQIELLSRAVERDPKFARAWVFRGQSSEILGVTFSETERERDGLFADAERDIRQGLALAPGLGSAYAELASMDMNRLRFRNALQGAQKALSLSPNDGAVLISLGNLLPWLGPIQKAIDIAKRQVSLEPLLPVSHGQLSNAYYAAGNFREAIAASQRALELSPQNAGELVGLSFAYLADGRAEDASRAAARIPQDMIFRTILLALIAARKGEGGITAERVAAIRAQLGDVASYQYAEIAALSGDTDRAFAALESAIRLRDPGLNMTMRDPFLASLRKDPRFGAILKRLDFPIVDA
jgi:TolB-like protein/Flp pilus assembly protein TadD